MIENIKELKWLLLIIVVISFGGFCLANTSPLEATDSQKDINSGISTQDKGLHQKLKEGCEIDAYIKQGENACEIKIRIKDDFAEPIPYNDIEFERVINVQFLKSCLPSHAQCETYNIYASDIVVYIKYKNQSKKSRHLAESAPGIELFCAIKSKRF